MRRALELWSCRNGPVRYNQWQSVYFALLRDQHATDEGAPLNENMAERQRRIRALYLEIQEAVHGPDHLAQSLLARSSSRRGNEQGAEPEALVLHAGDEEPRGQLGQDSGCVAAEHLLSCPAEEYQMYTP